jgi:protein gp37
MAQNSKIEWTEHTANLWHGCTKVHEGCDNCYAETLAKRWGNDIWGNDKPRKEIKSIWNDLLKYQKLAKAAGQIHRVFVGSMMDIFEKPMPLIDSKGQSTCHSTEDLRQVFFRDVIPASPNLVFLLLTKRPSNINKYIPESWKQNPPENVMFGTSPVNQVTFDKLVGQLLEVNGKRFLSIEPQLDFINLGDISGIDWIIQGGESGHHKRPFNLEWARFMRDQCASLNIPYFFKQIDKIQAIPEDLMIRQFSTI